MNRSVKHGSSPWVETSKNVTIPATPQSSDVTPGGFHPRSKTKHLLWHHSWGFGQGCGIFESLSPQRAVQQRFLPVTYCFMVNCNIRARRGSNGHRFQVVLVRWMFWVSIKFLVLSFNVFPPFCFSFFSLFSHFLTSLWLLTRTDPHIILCSSPLEFPSLLFHSVTHTYTHPPTSTHSHTHSPLYAWQNHPGIKKQKFIHPPSSHLPPIATQLQPPPLFHKLTHTLLHLLPCSLPLDAHIHTNTNAWRDVVIMNEATSFWAQGYKAIKLFGVLHGKTFVKPEEQTVLPTGGLNLNSARP